MIYAIIPARGGSKGIPGKNLRPLGGYPLIAYSIAAARLARGIDRVIVSTDSEEIAGVARRFGAEVPFMRPEALAGERSVDSEFMAHAIDWFGKNETAVPAYLVHLRPTTPLRSTELIEAAVKLILSQPAATSLRSAHEASESPFKWFLLGKDGFFNGIVPGYSNDDLNKARQTFPPVYVPDGYVDIINTAAFMASGLLHGPRMLGFVSPHCHEVDALQDLEYLEFEIKKTGSPLLEHLKAEFPL